MPKLSDTMTVGTLVSWLKKEGDTVSSGDMIAEIETDKATMEMEAFDDGILLKQLVKEGEQVDIGTPIAAIGEEGEELDPSLLEKKKPAKSTEKPKEDKKPKEEKPAAEAPAKTAPQPKTESPATSDDKRLRASPLARRLAEEHGVDLRAVEGSGPAGRILKKDVLQAAESGTAAAAKPAKADGPPPVPQAISGGAPIAEEEAIPVSNMRATIARRLLESKTEIPHYYLEVDVDAGPLMALRQEVNKSLEKLSPEQGGVKLSVNDFILKASAEALRRVPAVNASWNGDTIQQHASADVSFAVAIPEGLITPVIRNAQNKTVRQIAAEVRSLAWKARENKLKPDEFTGGTFTVSNLGMFGIDRFSAIINPPNAAILAVGTTRKVPVVKNDEIVIGQRMALTLSGDHRIVDGAVGAQFLAALRDLLENPALALV
ncbi:MAG TPA: pyruvate dehydrogenase complex dihydrolipoamide acetyltransferase [Opitutales bacterium]|nr:pyruvate dehydrogenase complex dihydrolipoamide acetyltransferase [Opitutales bacterium]